MNAQPSMGTESPQRVLLFGSGPYAEPFLRAAEAFAARTGTPVERVVSDASARPGGRLRRAALAFRRSLTRRRRERALARGGLPVRLAPDVNHPAFAAGVGPSAHGVVCGFRQIFSAELIARFGSLVNFHPSLLPYYRGPTPSYWALANGERVSGCTLHRVTAQIDRGEVLHQVAVDTAGVADHVELSVRIAERAAATLAPWLEHALRGAPFDGEQLDAAALYSVHVDYRSFPPRTSGRGGPGAGR